MTYLKIKDTQYPAKFRGFVKDQSWNDRDSTAITLEMTHEEAVETFVDDLEWAILYTETDSEGVVITEVYDNSEFSVAGPVTDNRDGTVTVKMGKLTAEEALAILTGGLT